jgi:hypothetical protein
MSLDLQRFRPEPTALNDDDIVEPRHTFEVYVDDSRYSVPTLYLIAADEVGAIEAAKRMVDNSPHHLGAELRLDGRRLIGFGSLAANDEAAE